MDNTRKMSGGKRKTCKNNMGMEGGKRKNMNMEGGKRKTRKNNMNMSGGKRKASPWNKFVKKIFTEMRRKDKDASFSDALKEASKRKKEM
jgi:hypothetical protein